MTLYRRPWCLELRLHHVEHTRYVSARFCSWYEGGGAMGWLSLCSEEASFVRLLQFPNDPQWRPGSPHAVWWNRRAAAEARVAPY